MFGDLHALTPQETLDRVQATVTGWWPHEADRIAAAFQSPAIQQWALSVAMNNHPKAKLIFANLLGLQDGAQVAKTAEA